MVYKSLWCTNLKYIIKLDNQPIPTFFEEQSICPLPWTLIMAKLKIRSGNEIIISNLHFADLADLLLFDTFDWVGGGGGGHLWHEAVRQSGDDNCAVVAGTY